MVAALNRAPKQRDMLLRAVSTNGGGLNGFSEHRGTWQALFCKRLVQGKSGCASSIVHTRLGLEVANVIKATGQ